MPPVRNERQVTKKRSINVILTPKPNEVLKKLRSENCAVHVFVPGESPENLEKLRSEVCPESVTIVTRAGLKRLKELQTEIRQPSTSSTSSESSTSTDDSSESEMSSG